MANVLLRKASTLVEILGYPSGLKLKLTDKAFEPGPFRVCSRLRSEGILPRTIVDVGANRGQFALAARRLFPEATVHSWEPGSEAFLQLDELARREGRMVAHRAGLARSPGRRSLRVTSNTQSSSFLELDATHKREFPGVSETGAEEVEVSTLEMELARLGALEEPLLLKLDVQGLELEVVEGAGEALGRFRWIVAECSSRELYRGQALFEALREHLAKRGFAFVHPLDLHLGGSGGVVLFDALFERSG